MGMGECETRAETAEREELTGFDQLPGLVRLAAGGRRFFLLPQNITRFWSPNELIIRNHE